MFAVVGIVILIALCWGADTVFTPQGEPSLLGQHWPQLLLVAAVTYGLAWLVQRWAGKD